MLAFLPSTSPPFPLATRGEISEAVLLRDVIFVFQGIEGEVLRYDIKQEAYRIDEKVSVAPSVRELCHKLAELGWIYRRVRNFIDSKSRDKNLGLVCQVRPGGGTGLSGETRGRDRFVK